MSTLAAVVLAAGKGTRMKSETPKVLFPVAGKPMLQHIVDTLSAAGVSETYVVVGYQAQQVKDSVHGDITWVEQRQQLGTGHALAQAATHLRDYSGDVLVLTGDIPLLSTESLAQLVETHRQDKNAATVLSAKVPEPRGYGRIVRAGNGRVEAITEEKDATDKERAINEINSGAYCFNWRRVGPLLERLNTNNAQGEYYLTDIFSLLVLQGEHTGAYAVEDYKEVSGVNDRVQLAQVEREMRLRINYRLMRGGVTIVDPHTTWIDSQVRIGSETVIMPNTHVYGDSQIGDHCVLGPDTTLRSCQLGNAVSIRNSVAEEATIGPESNVGPFAYLRPGAEIGRGVRIGDFVEIKNSQIGDGSKVPHLTYVGDAQVGSKSNIGCGVITANYDGKTKHKTEIGDDVFIGSNSNLIAPVKVEDGAYVAAGSTITDSVPARALAIARSRQTVKADWRKRD